MRTFITSPVILCSLIMGQLFGQAGTLDPSFNGSGMVLTSFGYTQAILRDVYARPDGSLTVIAVGINGGGTDLLIAQFLNDGQLDPGFGTGGVVTHHLSDGYAGVNSTAMQPDGKVVLFGSVHAVMRGYFLARLDTDGSLDGTFGDGGVENSMGDSTAFVCSAIALRTDGRILLAVRKEIVEGVSTVETHLIVDQRLSQGDPDPSFGEEGRLVIDSAEVLINAGVIAEQPDGKILLSGGYSNGGNDEGNRSWRLEGTGVPDAGFGNDGVLELDPLVYGGFGTVLFPGPERIWLGGSPHLGGAANAMASVQLQDDGTFDASYGTGGTSMQDEQDIHSLTFAQLQADGKILVVGGAGYGDPPFWGWISVVRLTPDGELDPTWNDNGVFVPVIGNDDVGTSLAIQPDQKIVVGGTSYGGSQYDVVLLRLLNDIDTDVPTVADPTIAFSLWPNPVNDRCTVSYSLKDAGRVTITVYDAQGRLTGEPLVHERVAPGLRHETIDMSFCASGVYSVCITKDDRCMSARVVKQ